MNDHHIDAWYELVNQFGLELVKSYYGTPEEFKPIWERYNDYEILAAFDDYNSLGNY